MSEKITKRMWKNADRQTNTTKNVTMTTKNKMGKKWVTKDEKVEAKKLA